VLAFLDYPSRTCGLGPTIWPTADIQADLKKIAGFYDSVTGRYPERQGHIELNPSNGSAPAEPGAEDR
jgi:hypothetical protein